MPSPEILTSPFDISGHLTIERRDARTHRLLSRWEKKNTIVHGAATVLGQLLAPNAVFGVDVQLRNQLKSMRFGSSNAVPQRTDIALGDPKIAIELTDADRTLSGAMFEFSCLMDSTTGNDITFREAAMYTRGDADDPNVTLGATMFSRQVFPDQDKDSLTELLFRWRFLLSY